LWYPFTIIEPTPAAATTATAQPSAGEADPHGGLSPSPRPPTTPDARGADPIECTILFGTVGYFTESLWKKLDEAVRGNGDDALAAAEGGDETTDRGTDADSFFDEETTTNHHRFPARGRQSRSAAPSLPVVLVDGFCVGSSDWIGDALGHDVLLIAAGGTGTTPFLTFLPRLLSAVLSLEGENHHPGGNRGITGTEAGNGSAHGDGCGEESSGGESSSSSLSVVTFLWCCRDEDLIGHVVENYLLPLFCGEGEGNNINGSGTKPVLFRLIVHNTSRDRSDERPFQLSHKRDSRGPPSSLPPLPLRGRPMVPPRIQHHPGASPRGILAGTLVFLSIAVAGTAMHFKLSEHGSAVRYKYSFWVRGYSLTAVVLWSFVVSVVAEVAIRWLRSGGGSSTCLWGPGSLFGGRRKGGYAAFGVPSGLPSVAFGDEEETDRGDESENQNSGSGKTTEPIRSESTGSETGSDSDGDVPEARPEDPLPSSLVPGTPFFKEIVGPGRTTGSASGNGKSITTGVLLELSISNGRPVLERGSDDDHDDDDTTRGVHPARAAAAGTSLRELAGADRPGVFYCGPGVLLESIRSRVGADRDERRRLSGGGDNLRIADCTFYEESFEM